MSRLKKVKKANGQIIAINEVRVHAEHVGSQSPSATASRDPRARGGERARVATRRVKKRA